MSERARQFFPFTTADKELRLLLAKFGYDYLGKLWALTNYMWINGPSITKEDYPAIQYDLHLEADDVETLVGALIECGILAELNGTVSFVSLEKDLRHLGDLREKWREKRRRQLQRHRGDSEKEEEKEKEQEEEKEEKQTPKTTIVDQLMYALPDYEGEKVEVAPDVVIPYDDGSKIKMSMAAYKRAVAKIGKDPATYQISELESYANTNPEKFRKYNDHASVIVRWHRMKKEKGLIYFKHPTEGPGYYPQWQVDKARS